MKKLVTLIIVAGLALTIQAQDITNTLPATGEFKVVENDGKTMFSVVESSTSQDPFVIIGPNANAGSLSSKRQLSIVKEGGTAGLNLYSYKGDGYGSFDKLGFYHARGTIASPGALLVSDELGLLSWWGYNGSWSGAQAAEIHVDIDAISNNSTAGRIVFATTPSGGSSPLDRMTIKSDGKVGIGTEAPNSTIQVNGSMALPIRSGGTTTLTAADYTHISSSGAVVTLPSAVGIKGRVYIIKNDGSGSSSVKPAAGEKIDGKLGTFTLQKKQVGQIQSDGTDWWIIAEH